MRIELRPMDQPGDGGITVGTADGEPLTYYGRTPHVGGVETSHGAIAEPLKDAVDAACNRLWGAEWSAPLAVVGVLNRRATSKDRVWKQGLPPHVLRLIGEAAAHPRPRVYGDLLLGVCRAEQEAYLSGRQFTEDELDALVLRQVGDAMAAARKYRLERAKAKNFEFTDTGP